MAGRLKKRTVAAIVLLLVVVAVDGLLVWRRARYRAETARLRAGMTEMERKQADAIIAAQRDEAGLMLELMRRQAAGDGQLHLAVSVDSGYVALDRGAARLRVMPARFGAEAAAAPSVPAATPASPTARSSIGKASAPAFAASAAPDSTQVALPRGARTIEQLLGSGDAFPLPRRVWTDRGQPVPDQRTVPGWVGSNAIVTSGNTLIYAMPTSGPLADSAYVMPGAVRVAAADLAAIRENLTRGMTVYFY